MIMTRITPAARELPAIGTWTTWSRAQTRTRLRALGGELRRIWSRPIGARARRRLLFELWGDCLEESEDGGAAQSAMDRKRAQVGMRARGLIVEFVTRELPRPSPSAYPPAELRSLNARRVSRARFEPYAASR